MRAEDWRAHHRVEPKAALWQHGAEPLAEWHDRGHVRVGEPEPLLRKALRVVVRLALAEYVARVQRVTRPKSRLDEALESGGMQQGGSWIVVGMRARVRARGGSGGRSMGVQSHLFGFDKHAVLAARAHARLVKPAWDESDGLPPGVEGSWRGRQVRVTSATPAEEWPNTLATHGEAAPHKTNVTAYYHNSAPTVGHSSWSS